MGNSPPVPVANEEIMIISSVTEIASHFIKDNMIIWHDPNVESGENISYVERLKDIGEVKSFSYWEGVSDYIKRSQAPCHVITSGTNGKQLLEQISEIPNTASVYVFCGDVIEHSRWAWRYSKIVCVEDDFVSLMMKLSRNMIKWLRESSPLRVSFPEFSILYDNGSKGENNPLNLYLLGLMNFTNREQSKRDFVNLARAVYNNRKEIAEFEKNYNEYNMSNMLKWYTRESFLYKVTNNCVRTATSDSIQHCRLIIRDLEAAIREQYQKKSKDHCGVLYRGVYMTNAEWSRLERSTGKDIEIYGFLSVNKRKEVGIAFAQYELERRALVTVVIPAAPDKGDKGFAEVKEYSDFPAEEEVLFNVQSQFTVLETTVEEQEEGPKYRHLVLLYGAQAMRKYMETKNPSVQIQISNPKRVVCNVCQMQIQTSKEPVFFISLLESNEYICRKCVQKVGTSPNKPPLFCVFSSTKGWSDSSDNRISLKVEGFVIHYPQNMGIPFYGYKCNLCREGKAKGYYKCTSCQDQIRVYCEDCCLTRNNDCVEKGHFIVLERNGFTFWSARTKEEESLSLKRVENAPLNSANSLFQEAEIYYQAHDYVKAEKCYLKCLQLGTGKENEQTAALYNNLGDIYRSLGDYEKAVEYHSKALDIRKLVCGENHPELADSANNLGLVYSCLREYEKAREVHLKALDIYKSVYGERDIKTAVAYNNLGNVDYRLKEFKRAIDFHSKALEIYRSVYGEQHQDISDSYNNLGLAYYCLGYHEQAIDSHTKALNIRKLIYGDKHPVTVQSYNNIGTVYFSLGQLESAKEWHSKALHIKKSVAGTKHSSLTPSYKNFTIGSQVFKG